MKAITTIEEIRQKVTSLKREGKRVGFVPTMGALHEGHLSLFHLAKQKADILVVSIYVNPEQFSPEEDFGRYPRRLESDLTICEEEGVDVVFAPADDIIYPSEKYFHIEIDQLNKHMDGASRPRFFEGVVLVVNKLFNILEPDIAVFGQKDIQQFRILQQMVLEMNHGVELVMGPIHRASDGLALSSRNAYLNRKERLTAPGLFRSLTYLHQQIREGANNLELLLDHQVRELEAKGFEIDYLNLYSFDKMTPVKKPEKNKKYIIAGAVYLGKTRLIDNMILEL